MAFPIMHFSPLPFSNVFVYVKVPLAVQEEVVFGGVEAAVRSCFNGVRKRNISFRSLGVFMATN